MRGLVMNVGSPRQSSMRTLVRKSSGSRAFEVSHPVTNFGFRNESHGEDRARSESKSFQRSPSAKRLGDNKPARGQTVLISEK
jgi:hypothetical protein